MTRTDWYTLTKYNLNLAMMREVSFFVVLDARRRRVCDQRIQYVIQHIHDSIVGEFPAEFSPLPHSLTSHAFIVKGCKHMTRATSPVSTG